jgi:hypothetical protein
MEKRSARYCDDDKAHAMTPANPIHRSFELAAERCEDLTPLVYRRLFREHPEAEAMFRRDGSDPVKGSMLALTIDAILDFAGDRSGHFRLIECEVSSHDAYGTPRELFGKFFRRDRQYPARDSRERLVARDRRGVVQIIGRARSRRHRPEPVRADRGLFQALDGHRPA